MPTVRSWSAVFVSAALAAACGGSVSTDQGATGGAGGTGGGITDGGTGGGITDGGTAGCGATGGAACGSCVYDGQVYPPGASFPASDGCNKCSCENGQVQCTLVDCVTGCEWNGKTYQPGEQFPAGDGCNACMCQEGGTVACTSGYCAPICVYAGKEYQVGEAFPSLDGCNKCSCTAQGVSCTEMACPCNPSKEWWRNYIGKSPQDCMAIKYACAENTTAFSNACGCGCEQDPSCPQTINCMPPAPNCDAMKKKCPLSGVVY